MENRPPLSRHFTGCVCDAIIQMGAEDDGYLEETSDQDIAGFRVRAEERRPQAGSIKVAEGEAGAVNGWRVDQAGERRRSAARPTVKDYLASIEKLRNDVAEAALTSGLATAKTNREMYARLYRHFNQLADEVEQAMKADNADTESGRE
jgi:hypothetical protein